MRKPLSGALNITILQAHDLDRPPFASKRGRNKPDSTVEIKLEGTPRARTHPSRNDKWHESFEVHVDKANEVEITIYDKHAGAGEIPIPIGMLWIRLNDVVEELRRRKAGNESGPGWVTAAGMDTSGGGSHASYGAHMDVPVGMQAPPTAAAPGPSGGGGVGAEGIEAWFAVEPEGQLQLQLDFGMSSECV